MASWCQKAFEETAEFSQLIFASKKSKTRLVHEHLQLTVDWVVEIDSSNLDCEFTSVWRKKVSDSVSIAKPRQKR